MKNEIYDSMLSRYDLTTEQNKRNAIFEVNQQVILGLLVKIVDKIGAISVYWSKLVDKSRSLPAFIISI